MCRVNRLNKYKNILISIECLLASMLIVDSFIRDIVSINFLTCVIALLFLILVALMKLEPDNRRYVSDAIETITIIVASYYILIYLFGLISGFCTNSNNFTLKGILTNIFKFGAYIVFCEMFRYMVATKEPKSKISLTLLVIVLSLCDVSDLIYKCNFNDISDTIALIGFSVVPSVIKNTALTYIALKVGFKPTIFYRFFMELPEYFLPIFPNTGEYVQTILNIAVPMCVFAYFWKKFSPRKSVTFEDPKIKTIKLSIQISLIVVMSVFVALISGFFKYQLLAVGSESMTPTILKGDAVMIRKLNSEELRKLSIGDILAFKKSNIVLVHRIRKIINSKGELFFRTKGDFNNFEDNFITKEEDAIGIVLFKVHQIGAPTVWLKELANF